MQDFIQSTILIIILLVCWYAHSRNFDLFALFIVLKTLSLLSFIPILTEAFIYDSSSIVIAILYAIRAKIIKSVIRIVLIIWVKALSNCISL